MNPLHTPRRAPASLEARWLATLFLPLLLLLLSLRALAGQAVLAWDASTSSSIAGYNVYYGQASGSYTAKLSVPNQTSYTVPNLTDGQTYYFSVTAFDSTGKESARSNEASVTVSSTATAPVPTFTGTPTTGVAPLSVAFAGSTTGGTATSYAWNFGDGTTSTLQNPVHIYSAAGNYNVALTAAGSGGSNTVVRSNYVYVTTPTATTPPPTTTACPCSIWAATAVPAKVSDPDTASVNLGVKFTASRDGYITGIRFYKGPYNTGTHVGTLWTATGTRLAQATFSGETASGWQQVNFATPVAIRANTVYVASYLAPRGRYAGDNNFFATTGVDREPLRALRNGVSGGNGVYAYSTSVRFPTSTYQASNYWVDVVFR